MFWCKSNPVERRDHQSQPPFYPRLPRGGRRWQGSMWAVAHNFYPRPPRGDDTNTCARCQLPYQFLSTSPARGTTAGRTGCGRRAAISIHVPREGDDALGLVLAALQPAFLSTSPARGTTVQLAQGCAVVRDFYPRPPRGGRLAALRPANRLVVISIHVPREGDDDWRKHRTRQAV